MNIIDFALQMELDGKEFYEKHARNMVQPELKKILLTLAEEEQKHYLFFLRLKEHDLTGAQQELATPISAISTGKTLFRRMTDEGTHGVFDEAARSIWIEALKIEEKVEKMYRVEAEKETDATRKALFARIADEEKTHVYLIDNMLSYMTDPQTFVESARYKNFLSWEGR